MKTSLQAFTVLWLAFLLSCQQKPLDRNYNPKTWWADVGEGSTPQSDSMNHEYVGRAVLENTIEGEKSEQYTYQELIDQGSSLPPLVGTDSLENVLRNDYERAKAIRGQAK